MQVRIEHLPANSDLTQAFSIREEVFNGEDGIPLEIDLDGNDTSSEQFMAYDGDDQAIGTARYRLLEDGSAKVERVAVRRDHRGQRVGENIMALLEVTAALRGVPELVLYSKTASAGFYEKLGYAPVGDVFMDVGLPHIKMVKSLTSVES